MTVALRPFRAADVVGLRLQSMQARDLTAPLDLAYGEMLAADPNALTAIDGFGTVIGCGGIAAVRPHYGIAWTLLDPEVGRAMVPVTRAVRRGVKANGWRRVEAIVRADWPAAQRWARLAGLQFRATLKNWGPDLGTFMLFDWTD